MDSDTFPPEQLVIPHDDYHGKLVGKTRSNDQFFITTPFTWGADESGREFVALYLFDKEGKLKSATIDELGSRESLVGENAAQVLPGNMSQENDASKKIIEKHLMGLGEVSYEDITIIPFSYEKYGIKFGLIPDEEEDMDEDEDPFYVTLLPGDYMAFSEPWDGEYDT